MRRKRGICDFVTFVVFVFGELANEGMILQWMLVRGNENAA